MPASLPVILTLKSPQPRVLDAIEAAYNRGELHSELLPIPQGLVMSEHFDANVRAMNKKLYGFETTLQFMESEWGSKAGINTNRQMLAYREGEHLLIVIPEACNTAALTAVLRRLGVAVTSQRLEAQLLKEQA